MESLDENFNDNVLVELSSPFENAKSELPSPTAPMYNNYKKKNTD